MSDEDRRENAPEPSSPSPADGEADEEEGTRIRVRDRRRVTLEGEIREVEEPPAFEFSEVSPEPSSPPRSEPPVDAPRRGRALGGAQAARVKKGDEERPPLREVGADEQPSEPSPSRRARTQESDEERRVETVYEYVIAVASEMMVWSLASLGLVANPVTRIVTTDMAQAEFAIDTAIALIDTLLAKQRLAPDEIVAVHQSFVVQFASVAAQLLNQQPAQRLRDIAKIRFCIDTADRFVKHLQGLDDGTGAAQLSEMRRFMQELHLAFVQASGGGGIVG